MLHLTTAAEVNWIRRYRDLRQSNVVGTLNVIAFCTTSRVKYLSYISTVRCVDGFMFSLKTRTESHVSVLALPQGDLYHMSHLARHSGYGQSKWVAEAAVRHAIAQGLPAVVHRPGMVAAHSATGAGNVGMCRREVTSIIIIIILTWTAFNIIIIMT